MKQIAGRRDLGRYRQEFSDRTMIFGLTGAIGSGKSTALAAFAECGAEVFDADRMCHSYYMQPDSPVVSEIKSRWGGDVLNSTGGVDRAKLGEKVFRNKEELANLTRLVYPVLEKEMRGIINSFRKLRNNTAVIEIPLLFEYGWEQELDGTIALWTDMEVRYKRLLARGLDSSSVAEREKNQTGASYKLEKADYGLINNGSADLLKEQCRKLFEILKEKA